MLSLSQINHVLSSISMLSCLLFRNLKHSYITDVRTLHCKSPDCGFEFDSYLCLSDVSLRSYLSLLCPICDQCQVLHSQFYEMISLFFHRLEVVSERNDRKRYPRGSYVDIEHHLLKLALVNTSQA